MVEREADDAENDGQNGEAHQLDGLATDGVDQGDRHPVTGDGAGADDDQVADGLVVEGMVHVAAADEADGLKDDGVVEAETVKGHVEEEPRTGGAEEDFTVLPLAVVVDEVTPARFGCVEVLGGVLDGLNSANFVGVTLGFALHVRLGIFAGFLDVASDIESVARGFGDGQTVVQGDAARDGTEADDDTPHLVHRQTTDATTVGGSLGGLQRLPEASRQDQGDDGRGELTDTLHGKHGTHHRTSPLGGGEPVRTSIHRK